MAETRTFIAARLSAETLAALEALVGRLRASPGGEACRWSAPETVHLTLKFLGNVPDARLEEVFAAADRAARSARPLRFVVAGVGCFPNAARPRIVWAGVREGHEALARLAERLDAELGARGFAREERAFRPHLTIGRVGRRATREAVAALGRTISGWDDEVLGHVDVDRIHVFGSELTPGGPVHTVLHEAPLRADPPEGAS